MESHKILQHLAINMLPIIGLYPYCHIEWMCIIGHLDMIFLHVLQLSIILKRNQVLRCVRNPKQLGVFNAYNESECQYDKRQWAEHEFVLIVQ